MNNSIHTQFRLIFTFLIFLFVSGCGTWDNFTTYFNLYYNSSLLFEKCEEQIYIQKRDLFSPEDLVVPGSVNNDLVKVIEKSSVILQYHSETGYVEDALMMLGKSFYYQRNYQKSQRKFLELLSADPDGDYALEAELWIGKCQMKLKNFSDGLITLTAVRGKAIEEDEEKIILDAFLEEIIYKVNIEDYAGAITLANELMTIYDDDNIKAEVWYEIGNLNMKLNDIENAIIAYENVFDFSPGFDLEVDAKLKFGRALRLGGRKEDAYEIFTDMKSEDKYVDKYAEIDFEIGKSLAILERYEEAVEQFTIVDTTYKNNPSSAAAKYEIAYLYETAFLNFDSAAVYYKKASSSTLPKEYILIAKEKTNLFNRHQGYRSNLNNYERQLFYSLNPDEFIKDSIAYVEDSLATAEEIANIKEFQEIWSGLDDLLSVTDTTGFYQDTIKVIDSILVNKLLDSLLVRDTTQILTRDSVFTKLRDPVMKDTVVIALFDSMFTNRLLDPAVKLHLEQRKREEQARQNQFVQQLPDTLKFKNNPPRRSKIPIDSLKTLISKNQLELGNLFLTELNLPDSAYWYYNSILTDYPNTIYQATALYSMGSYYLTINEKNRADSLFNIIYENYRNESIVNAAADKLNKPFIDLDYDPASDDFIEAESLLLEGNYSESVAGFYNIFLNYPESLVAPKAIYTCGWIMENELYELDSAAVYYDSLVVNYPSSEYVRKIAPKLSLYKQEKRKIETALEDSLLALQMTLTDSTIYNSGEDSSKTGITEVPGDSVQVVMSDEKPVTKPGETIVKKTELQSIKEPVWNPRKRK